MQANASSSPGSWDPERFRQALGALREHLHVKQAVLALWADVSPPQISRWNKGASRPGHDSLRRMLATAQDQAPEDDVLRRLTDEVADAAGYPGLFQPSLFPDMDGDQYYLEEWVNPRTQRVVRMVRNLERKTQGMSEEERAAIIDRALTNAEQQAEMMLDAELLRRERGSEDELF